MPSYNSFTIHTPQRSGANNMYLSRKFTIVQMMHVNGPKTQKTFMNYISSACHLPSKRLSSDEIADEIDAIANPAQNDVF